MIRRAAFALVIVACGSPPPLQLKFRITPGAEESCPSAKGGVAAACSDVTMVCPAVVSIQIFDPNDPSAPYLTVCKELTGKPDLCSIAGVDLPQPMQAIPSRTLEVEMVVYPKSALSQNAGQPLCPTDVRFTATGFPQTVLDPCTDPDPTSCPIVPAVGGRAFYHPGDTETVVDLGCSDLAQLTDPTTCGGLGQVAITATVDDFDTEVPVSPSIADQLSVAVGVPTAVGSGYVLNTTDERPLDRTALQPIPGWSALVDLTFPEVACLEVFEEVAQSTAVLTCKPAMSPKSIDLLGIRIARSTLTDILGALGQTLFPDTGLVVGIVLDYLGNPAPNFVVSASDATAHVEYLSSDRHNLITGGTSSSGVFVSRDAAWKTIFSTSDSITTVTGYGGLVANKVTAVVLQLPQKVVGGSPRPRLGR